MKNEVVQAAKEAAPNVESKLVEMLDALQNGAVKVGEQVVKYSPDVADAALWVVRIDGIQNILFGLSMLILSFFAYGWINKFWAWGKKRAEEESDGIFHIGPCVASIPFISVAILAFDYLTNVWNYIAIFEPKLWLAKQIIKAALN